MKIFDAEIVHNKRGYQIECPTYNHSKVRAYLVEFEAKLAKKSFEIPPKYRSNKELDQAEARIRDFIQRHTFTVMYDINKADWTISFIGYRKVIEMMEKSELGKFRSVDWKSPFEKSENSKEQKNGISPVKGKI